MRNNTLSRRAVGRFPSQRLLRASAILPAAMLGAAILFASPLDASAAGKAAAKPSPAAVLKRSTPSALAGNRESIRAVAKAVVALGPQEFSGSATLRPLFRREALAGSSASAAAYGMMLQYGIGGAQNIKEAPSWYARGAADGNKRAGKHAAVSYALGWGVPRSNAKALKALSIMPPEARAKQMLLISEALLQPGREEPNEAMEWLRRVAALKTKATVEATKLYESLAATDPKADSTVQQWLRETAASGNTDAAMALGNRLLAANGDAASREEAAKWYLLAAEKRDERGFQALTGLVASGSQADAGRARIFDFLDKRANDGSNAARIALSDALAFSPDADEALRSKGRRYLTLAAKDGDPDAQYKLAMLMLSGQERQSDPSLAKAYLTLAAARGNKLAANAVSQFGGMPEAAARKIVTAESAGG